MAKPKPSVPVHRLRFNVPEDDTVTMEWLEAQSNPSVSLRLLIREDISENGCVSDILVRTADKMPSMRKKRSYTPRGESRNEEPLLPKETIEYKDEPQKEIIVEQYSPESDETKVVEPVSAAFESKGLSSLAVKMSKMVIDEQNGIKSPANEESNIGTKVEPKNRVNRRSAAEMGLM